MSYGSMFSYAKGIWNNTIDMDSRFMQFLGSPFGYTQYRNTLASTQAQIDYNDYIKQANERAQADWYRNVGGRRTIAYPELSYAGAIYRADTSSARSMYDSNNAFANFAGNIPYRAAGLYGIGSRISRWL